MDLFSQLLTDWFALNRRDLPWRSTNDPYKIWISEVILQQTRVAQGLAYYTRFIDQWPDIQSLAAAPEQEVMKMWQGLGYYSRARNLLVTARELVKSHQSHFPGSSAELKKLKGIGEYTAAAIASIAFHEPVAVVDGNVYRFFSRYFGITDPVNTPSGMKLVRQIATEKMRGTHPALFNQALMEFGALRCTPKAPQCAGCPFQDSCYANRSNAVLTFPVKKPKVIIRTRFFTYTVFRILHQHKWHLYLKHRTDKDIWKGLFEFPVIEAAKMLNYSEIVVEMKERYNLDQAAFTLHFQSENFTHQLTHQRLEAVFFVFTLQKPLENAPKDVSLIELTDVGIYPLPRLIDRFLEKESQQLNLY